jgi:beta-lactam-binding protein with PASTA domain
MTVRVISGDPDSTESSGNTVMPDLFGLSVIDANARMDGLNMDGARAYSCGEGSVGANPGDGTVTSQSMGAGTLVWNYVAVQLTVACGVTPTPVEEEFLD